MQVFLSFGPWIVFWVIAPFNRVAGAFSALGVCAAVNAYRLARRRGKIPDIGTLAFFIFLSAISFSVSEAWMDRWAFVIADFALLAIILVSLAIRRPFTLRFAREQVPREQWEQPLFISITRSSPGYGPRPWPGLSPPPCSAPFS